ncbi:MAG TPA: cysteine desulfurase NifS [Chloroflexi bacterium]|jgi:cysteine desulfurase|nr:cysteine desulfurase NifS [Chloroflexota bacterium]
MENPSTPAPRQPVYLDHAATTAVDPRVVEAMLPYFSVAYGNPSSLYRLAAEAKNAVDRSRTTVAEILGARPGEILFTSCGTESDNLALRGAALAARARGNHIITTPIEHHAVINTCEQLAQALGCEVTYVPVDRHGLVDPDAIGRAITPRTVLISVMYANNEIGTIEPIAAISRIARRRGILMHTDAVQAAGSLPLDVDTLGVDMLSLSGHKFYAPKGVGVLYVRRGTPLLPTQTGGAQEGGRRAGTENVPAIVGLATALRLAYDHLEDEVTRLQMLRDRLIAGVLGRIPDTVLTGHPSQRLANNASFVFAGIEGESLLLQLDLAGVAASSGSACASSEEGASHVLTAIGLDTVAARGSLRLSLGRENTAADVDYVLDVLPGIVEWLRAMSPLYAAGSAVAGTGTTPSGASAAPTTGA